MAWEDILPAVSGRRGSAERIRQVTMAWRITSGRSGPSCVITLGGEVVQNLGWKEKSRARVQIDRAAGLLRVAVPEEGGNWSLLGKKGEKLLHITFPLPLTAEKQPAARVEHEIANGALVLALPEWARVPRKELLHAAALAKPDAKAARQAGNGGKHKKAVEMPGRAAALPTDAEDTNAADEREAETMVVAGKGARAIAEEFGWELARAQDFAARVRERKAA